MISKSRPAPGDPTNAVTSARNIST
jgi:hypothetical protein